MFTLSIATATVIVDKLEFDQPNKKHFFNMFALSVATANVSVDTILFCVQINNYHFLRVVNTLTLLVINIYTQNYRVDTIGCNSNA